MPDGVRGYYDQRGESEWHRLALPFDGEIEWEIHSRALEEWLPPGGRILDLGGGPGRWAIWLARRGHRVVLADLSPRQLEIARRESAAAGVELEAILEVDARDLSAFGDGAFDAVVALGPLYHLVAEADRERARDEMRRVLRPSGRLFASVMTRVGWALTALFSAAEPDVEAAAAMLDTGTYIAPPGGPFADAHLSHPSEVCPFFAAAGFTTRALLASQSFLYTLQEPAAELRERDPDAWRRLLDLAYAHAGDATIQGTSGHLLWVGDRDGAAAVGR